MIFKGEDYYTLSGHALLSNENGPCGVCGDCKAGLDCGRSYKCEKLTHGNCELRGDEDCSVLNDPLRTKCYQTEGPSQCACDNDPKPDLSRRRNMSL